MQRPWQGMNPMQVVAAVGFQQQRLTIPPSVDESLAALITACWKE